MMWLIGSELDVNALFDVSNHIDDFVRVALLDQIRGDLAVKQLLTREQP